MMIVSLKPAVSVLSPKFKSCSFKAQQDKIPIMSVDNSDYFDKDTSYEEKVSILKYSANDVHLVGSLDNKNYNLRFTQKNPRQKKNINISGYYGDKKVDMTAYYDNEKHHYYSGTIGGKEFEIKHRIGGLFINGYMKGKINGKDFCAKFPVASASDENRDLMVLLLHTSGYVAPINGYNFGHPEASLTCYEYYDGGKFTCLDSYTLFDEIWRDPILTGPNPFNQV